MKTVINREFMRNGFVTLLHQLNQTLAEHSQINFF